MEIGVTEMAKAKVPFSSNTDGHRIRTGFIRRAAHVSFHGKVEFIKSRNSADK